MIDLEVGGLGAGVGQEHHRARGGASYPWDCVVSELGNSGEGIADAVAGNDLAGHLADPPVIVAQRRSH